ncbi:Y+L amino acid transporter 2 [Chionoecetes opilio]|uniref:Y+L amino acid transporter 2 n=1 Tax=Chionoecetes opilio TaxID=41210 RepID=A0A8J5CTP6_CHIOP|nr:Y+L amino acid transporter 2 [Chionoecetes opilio]
MEELKDPFRNFPRAIAISVTCVIVIYILTNVAYFAVLPKDLMLASPAVAVTFGNLTLGVMAWTIPVFVACSISGGLNGSTITSSRLLFVSARRGHLPRLLSFVHIENNTPVTSLIFLTLMSMLMFVTSDVRVLINYLSFAGNLMALMCISSFFWFRVKHPDWPRPIKVWIGFPIIYIVLSFFLCVMPVVKQPLEVVAALVILATGIPVYYFFVYREQKPQCLLNAMGLKKELGLVNCVGIMVGNIMGTGIFVSPRAVLQYSGSVGMSLLVWVISGVMCIVGAFCYAELGTMIPQTGGNYAYLYEAYGSFPAFIYLWTTVTIIVPGGRAVMALTFANYVLQPFFPDGQPPPDSALRLVGIALMVILTYVNYKKVRWATRVQDLLALTKVFALIVIIVVGMCHLFRGTTQNYEDPMEGTTTNAALLASAFYHTFYAYDGW